MARTRISGGVLCGHRAGGAGAAGHRHGDAAAGQGAQLQQPQRHRRGLRAGGGIRAAGRAPSSSTPIPAAWPRPTTWPRPFGGRWPATPSSAYGGIIAVNRPLDAGTGGGDRQAVRRGDHRAGGDAAGARAAGGEAEPTGAGGRRHARSAGAPGMSLRSVAGGYLLQGRDDGRVGRADLKTVTKRAPSERGAGGPAVRVPRRQACEIERHRLCEGGRHRGHRRRADEPRRLGAHRGLKAQAAADAAGETAPRTQGLGGGLRRLLPLRRRPAGRDRGRRHRGDPARRLACATTR